MKYLVSGGSGFLGVALIKQLISEGHEVRVLARNEGKLVELKEKYPVEIVVGNVSDPFTCDKAVQGVDGIFHLAALKHIGIAEENVKECIESNIPLVLLEATRKYKPEFIIGISTDKAASRKGVYGTTKFLMERLFDEYQTVNPDTKYRIVRYGNVIYSTGSVLCKWKEKILKGEEIQLTHPAATRFFWTVDEAIKLIFDCLAFADSPKPFVAQMKSMRVIDLMEAMMEKYGNGEYRIGGRGSYKVIGLQPGENMDEIIIEGGISSAFSEMYSKAEIMELI